MKINIRTKKSTRYPTGGLTLLQTMGVIIVLTLAISITYSLFVHTN